MKEQYKFINESLPAIAIHPGEYLIDQLDARELKQREFANEVGMAYSQLNEIIKGKRSITAEFAMTLEAILGIDKRYWLNLQMNYDLTKISLDEKFQKKTSLLKRWSKLKEYAAVKYFRKLKKLSNILEKDEDFLLKVYNVSKAQDINVQLESAAFRNFKKSNLLKVDKINLLGWVKYVEYRARNEKKKIGVFQKDSEKELVGKLKSIFLGNDVLSNIEKLLPKYGIKLIIEPKADQVPVDGLAFWSDNNPAIGLTIRHKRLDNLAFTLLHELGHVYMHLEKNNDDKDLFIDDIAGNKGNRASLEKQANTFAENHLIPKKKWKKFINTTDEFSSETINAFAEELGIHPAIPLGRLKHEYNEFYKRRFGIPNKIL